MICYFLLKQSLLFAFKCIFLSKFCNKFWQDFKKKFVSIKTSTRSLDDFISHCFFSKASNRFTTIFMVLMILEQIDFHTYPANVLSGDNCVMR